MFFASRRARRHIITTQVEHPAIVEPCRFLERLGARITWLPVDGTGQINPDDLRLAITADTILMSVMHANNEVGTIQPIEECAVIAREHGIPFHTDAAQSVGKISTCVDQLGVDMLTIAGHKLYAPKGVGALYVRAGADLEPLIHGAGHESGRRAGTESAVLTAALGEACALATNQRDQQRTKDLRDYFWDRLKLRFGDRVVLNGHPSQRLPNTLNVSFVGLVGADILAALDGVAASTGSACHSGRVELSPVLAAMKVPEETGMDALRFSIGRFTTTDEIREVKTPIGVIVRRQLALSLMSGLKFVPGQTQFGLCFRSMFCQRSAATGTACQAHALWAAPRNRPMPATWAAPAQRWGGQLGCPRATPNRSAAP